MRSLSLFLVAVALSAQTMSIEEYEPKSTLVVPQHIVTRARYPFIDVHNHQYGLTPEKVDKLVADAGTTLLVVEQIDNNLKLAARNVSDVLVEPADSVNTYELLRFDKIVATKAGFERLTARVSK